MNITALHPTTNVKETFSFPRCPSSKYWYGYIKYFDGSLEYGKEKIDGNEKAEREIKEDIVNRINRDVEKYVSHVQVTSYTDILGSVMFCYNLFSENKVPIRMNLTNTELEVFISNRWKTLSELRKKEEARKEGDLEVESRWIRIRTRIGQDKLMELLADLLKQENEIGDIKIHLCGGGLYAVHKSERA